MTRKGKKAKTSYNLSSLRSLCEIMEGLKETIDIHLETQHTSTKGDKGKVETALVCLQKQLRKAMKGGGSSSQRGMHQMHRSRKGTLVLDRPRKKVSSQDVKSVASEDTNPPMSKKRKTSEDTNQPMSKKRKTSKDTDPPMSKKKKDL